MSKLLGLLFLILLSLQISSAVYANTNFCNGFLASENLEDSTAVVISYMEFLFGQKIINEKSLQNLIEGIKDKKKMINPIFKDNTQSAHGIHYDNMEEYLKRSDLDQQAILKWADIRLKQEKKMGKEKEQAQEKTQSPFIPMTFYPVNKGKFEIGEPGKKISAEIVYDIEVMSTKVTQAMWAKELGSNPAVREEWRWNAAKDKITINLGGKSVLVQPDYPVDNITWYAAAMFANLLSIKHGFKEVYDFSGVNFKSGTKVEDGTLDIEEGEVKIHGGNIYETEGYRLPTGIEQEYLLSDRGRSKTDFFTGVIEENLKDYAWFFWNSNLQHYEVAKKLPLVIDGHAFYDLMGTAWEWSNDICKNVKKADFDEPKKDLGLGHAYRGGSYDSHPNSCRSYVYANQEVGPDADAVGFRLVRTKK